MSGEPIDFECGCGCRFHVEQAELNVEALRKQVDRLGDELEDTALRLRNELYVTRVTLKHLANVVAHHIKSHYEQDVVTQIQEAKSVLNQTTSW